MSSDTTYCPKCGKYGVSFLKKPWECSECKTKFRLSDEGYGMTEITEGELTESGEEIPFNYPHRPICPECGMHSIILHTPTKEYLYPGDGTVHPDAYSLPSVDTIDWEKSNLYCCNASTNCKFNTLLTDLSRPKPQ